MAGFRAHDELKLVVLGGGGVGKSALTIRFINDQFLEEYDPTIEDSYRKQVVVDGVTRVLDILDTAGQEEFSSMQDQWMRDADGFLLVYSITSRASFSEIEALHQKLLRVKDCDSVPCIVVGNKSDLAAERCVLEQEGRDTARSCRSPFFETSAKLRVNVSEAFLQLARLVLVQKSGGPATIESDTGCFPCCRSKRVSRPPVSTGAEEFHIVVLGGPGVGKSTMTIKYATGVIPEGWDICEDSYRKQIEVDGRVYILDILDTTSQEEFSSMQDGFLRNGRGFVLMYSINSRSTFDGLDAIYRKILRVKDCDADQVPCIVVGNKTDLPGERAVSEQDGREFARSCGRSAFLEISATTLPVDSVFETLIRLYTGASTAGVTKKKAKPKKAQKREDDEEEGGDVADTSNREYHTGSIWCQLLNDGVLYTGSRDCTARAWNVRTGEHLMCYRGHTSRIYSLAVCERILATGSGDSTIRLWNVKTGECLRVLTGHETKRSICTLVFDGALLYSASTDQTVRIWDSTTGACLSVLPCESKLNALVVSGNRVFAGCLESHDVKVFELGHEQSHNSLLFVPRLVETLTGHSNYVMHVLIRPGRSGHPSLLFTASSDKTIRSWDLASLKLVNSFEGHKDWVNAIAATDHLLFSASRDTTAKSWDISTGKCVRDFIGHNNSVRAIAVTPQGDFSFRVATAGKDKSVRIWHSGTGECLWLFEGCEDWINCLSISGTIVFAGSRDNTVRSWDISTGILHRIFSDRKKARWGELQPRLRVCVGTVLLIIEFLQLVSFAFTDEVKWVSHPFTQIAPVVQVDLKRYQVNTGFGPVLAGVLLFLACYLGAYKVYAWRTLWGGGLKAWACVCLVCKLCSTIFFIPICKPLVQSAMCASTFASGNCYASGEGEVAVIVLLLFLPPAFRLAAADGQLDSLAFYFWNPFVYKHDHADLRKIHPFSRASAVFDRYLLLLALLMILFSVAFSQVHPDPIALQLSLFACSLAMCIDVLRYPPYHHPTVNGGRFASFVSVVLVNAIALINSLVPDPVWTTLSLALTPVVFCLTFAMLRWRGFKKLAQKRKELRRQAPGLGVLLID